MLCCKLVDITCLLHGVSQITEKDEAVLEHLIDISVEELDGEDDDDKKQGDGDEDEDEDDEEESGFRLTFTFEPNEFFSETTLVRCR